MVNGFQNSSLQSSLQNSSVLKNVSELAYQYFIQNRELIISIAQRYLALDPAVDLEDLLMEGYLGILDALRFYDPTRGGMKISTFIYWAVQKRFRSLLPGKDKVVVLLDANGNEVGRVPYHRFKKGGLDGEEGKQTVDLTVNGKKQTVEYADYRIEHLFVSFPVEDLPHRDVPVGNLIDGSEGELDNFFETKS